MNETGISVYDELMAGISSIPLSQALLLARHLARDLENKEFEQWIRLESEGYFSENTVYTADVEGPRYRIIGVQHSDEYGRPLVIQDAKLRFVNEYFLRNGVGELEKLEKSTKTLIISDPLIIELIREHLNIEVTKFSFSPASVTSVLSAIRSKLQNWLFDVRKDVDRLKVAEKNNSFTKSPKEEKRSREKNSVFVFLGHRVWAGIGVLVAVGGIFVPIFMSGEKPRPEQRPSVPSEEGPSSSPKYTRGEENKERDRRDIHVGAGGVLVEGKVEEGSIINTGNLTILKNITKGDRILQFSELPPKSVLVLQNELRVTQKNLKDIYTKLEHEKLSPYEFQAKLYEYVSKQEESRRDTISRDTKTLWEAELSKEDEDDHPGELIPPGTSFYGPEVAQEQYSEGCNLYAHERWTGPNYPIAPNEEIARLSRIPEFVGSQDGGMFNDSITSVGVSSGCELDVFKDSNFNSDRGIRTHTPGKHPQNIRVEDAWNDSISSARCRCTYTALPERCVLYKYADYEGDVFPVRANSFFSHLPSHWNDQVSAVHVPHGCTLTVYDHVSLSHLGDSHVFTGDSPYIGAWNNKITSVECRCPR